MDDSIISDLAKLTTRVDGSGMPQDLAVSIKTRVEQLKKMTSSPTFMPEFDRLMKYIDWCTKIPWNKKTQDNLDLTHASQVLEANHYGLADVKNRILEYVSVLKLKKESGGENAGRAPILCFVGLVGTGKTTIATSIGESLNRKFARIPFGGMGDPLDLRGQSRVHPESEPGKVIKALVGTQSENPVILLDEIDRVTDQGRSSIMGVLVELLDPEQNHAFVDHYIDYPVDLSGALFIATANNTHNIATAVMDRLEPIMMPSYTDNEKIVIGQKYMMPRLLAESGIPAGALVIDESVWPQIVRPLGFDAGIRTLQRNIEGAVRKAARLLVEGKTQRVIINSENIKEFLPQ